MGLFSNIKNAITGGAAAVTLTMPAGAKRGEAFAVTINATAKGSGNVKSVYLLVRAIETAEVDHQVTVNGQSRTEKVHGSKTTYETKMAIAPAFSLTEGQAYTWGGTVTLPATSNPTFKGQMVKHTWELEAGLEMTGNDPDSGWKPLDVA
jgi:hypothetical protein